MIWVDQYVGIPHLQGGIAPPAWDCWGCARYVLAVHAGIYLPLESEQLDRSQWVKVDTPQAFDIAEMPGLCMVNGRTRIAPVHIGVFVSDKLILHCEIQTGTVCVPVDRLHLPILGIWRYEK